MEIPMSEVEKIIYKGEEINAFNIAGCKWRKKYNLEFYGLNQLGTTDIVDLDFQRTSESNSNNNNLSGDSVIEDSVYEVNYGDTIEFMFSAADFSVFDVPEIFIEANGDTIFDGFLDELGDVENGSATLTINIKSNVFCEMVPGGYKPYKLTITKGTGVSSVTVRRTSSKAGGTLGVLSSGATIYYYDVLTVTASANSGYAVDTYTKNITANGNVNITITAKPKLNAPTIMDQGETVITGSSPPYTISAYIDHNNEAPVDIHLSFYDQNGNLEKTAGFGTTSNSNIRYEGLTTNSTSGTLTAYCSKQGYANSDTTSLKIYKEGSTILLPPEFDECYIDNDGSEAYIHVIAYNRNNVTCRMNLIFRDEFGDIYGADYTFINANSYGGTNMTLDSSQFASGWTVEAYFTASGYTDSETAIYEG